MARRAEALHRHLAAGAGPLEASGAAGLSADLEALRVAERPQNATVIESVPAFEALVGQQLGLSAFFQVEQERVDAFSVVMNDPQFIHERDAVEKGSPFSAPVAHGFMTLGLISMLSREALPALAGVSSAVNLGFNRVRFVAPVYCGSRVRARVTLKSTRQVEGALEAVLDIALEREGEEKPGVVAEWVVRFYL